MTLLTGGVALVTGAASGIGRASALAFAQEGADVVVVADLDRTGGEETVDQLRAFGTETRFFSCDVSRSDDVANLVSATTSEFGRLDYAHNSAGIGPVPARIVDVKETDWDRLVAIHLKGTWLCLKSELQAVIRQGSGAIVNTSSTAGLVSSAMVAPYSAVKSGVIGLTRSAALEVANSNIRVNAVCPGHTDTPMHRALTSPAMESSAEQPAIGQLGRLRRNAEPEEQGRVAVWLCSNQASYVTGAVIAVDGGQTAQLSE